jgi:hypothetical protein
MTMTTRDTSDNSVTFSLAELAKIEEERVRSEDIQRARARERDARERHEAEARRRAEEAAQVAAEAEARARARREEAEEKARAEARERAAVEVARIAAEAKTRLDADNAARAHELAVIRVQNEGGRRRMQHALVAVIGLVLLGGSAAAYGVKSHVASLEADADRLREGQSALSREREDAKAAALATLDRRYASLRARQIPREAEEARATAEAARSAVDAKALDHSRLRAFGDALDVLEARLSGLEKLASLDRRHADLTAWAAERRRSDLAEGARAAAARAKSGGADESSLKAYESALDRLRDSLARPAAAGVGAGALPPPDRSGPKCTDPHDPLCGFDGKSL